MRKVGLYGIHPLTRRYIFNQFSSQNHG
ncbi:TPA: hypothetical protein I7778_20875 [Vibrio vulnificus]|nr:hypothetical protein [Vibrio vulnificus]